MKVPFTYSMEVRTSSGHYTDRTYREILDVEVAETSPDRFPLVVSTPARGRPGDDEWRLHDGNLYAEVWSPGYGQVPSRPLSLDDLESAFRIPGGDPARWFKMPTTILNASSVKLKGPPKRHAVQYGYERREEAIQKVTRFIDGLVACEGRLYRQVPEPVLVLSLNSAAYWMTTDALEPRFHPLAFRLTDIEEARRFAAEYHRESPGTVAFPEYEVHLPEALSSKFEYALSVSCRELGDMVAETLASHPLPVMGAYCDLRDVDFGAARDRTDADRIARALALCDAMETHGVEPELARKTRLRLARISGTFDQELSEEDVLALEL